jgi:hypothetical protein
MGKELCKLKDLYRKDFEVNAKKVNHSKVVCTKCERATNKKKYVCCPRKIGKAI